MKKILLLVSVLFFAGMVYANAQVGMQSTKVDPVKTVVTAAAVDKEDATKKKVAKITGDHIDGRVISLNKLNLGGDGAVTKEEAKKLAKKGQPIVFMSDKGKLYFVYNSDGSFAGRNLAKYASNKKIAIQGKTKAIHGVRVLFASKIAPLD